MFRNLVAFAAASALVFVAGGVHRLLFRRLGGRPWGRAAAYVAGGIIYGIAIGVGLALTNEGWHRVRGMTYETRTTTAEGLALGVGLGTIFGLAFFVQSERRGKGPFLPDLKEADPFPADYIEDVLSVEATISARERDAMARHLEREASKRRRELPPELRSYVDRNRGAV